ncbi:SF1B family DNA helicase RecD2 [Thermaerobacter litoralis]
MAVVYGLVEAVLYTDPARGFAILALRDPEGETVRALGPLAAYSPGHRLRLEGEWTDHPKHGRQFRVHAADLALARPEYAAELMEAVLRGIGPVLAERIVGVLGPNAVAVIQADPSALERVPGVGRARARAIRAQLEALAVEHEIHQRLAACGVPPAAIRQLLEWEGAQAWTVFRADPYRAGRRLGAPWPVQERWAQQAGLAPTARCRIVGAILWVLGQAAEEGHVGLPRTDLEAAVQALVGRPGPVYAEALPAAYVRRQIDQILAAAEDVVGDADHVYLPRLYWAERQLAEALLRLSRAPVRQASPESAEAVLEAVSQASGLSLAPEQAEAVRAAVAGERPLVVLTGGPGTGKSTVVQVLCDVASALWPGWPLYLVAPTGLAAQNLAARTGREAGTIHRLLEPQVEGGRIRFGRGPSNPLPQGLLVVDETSMVDLELAAALLGAVASGSRIVFVGDEEQLPAVGPGSVFSDLIRSEHAQVVRLQTVYRQAQDSPIVRAAYAIRRGRPEVPHAPPRCLRVRVRSAEDLVERLDRIARAIRRNNSTLTVLVPQRSGPVGTEALNARLQAIFNPPAPGQPAMVIGGRHFRAGDRVMQTQNLYATDGRLVVANGTLGTVQEAGPSRIVVDFGTGEAVAYGPQDAQQGLRHAWAITIHKSQGLEFPGLVVLALAQSHGRMLSRALAYTAVTRAKERLLILEEADALDQAVARQRGVRRHGLLLWRLAQGRKGGGADATRMVHGMGG